MQENLIHNDFRTVHAGDSIIRDSDKIIRGEIVNINGESYYRISNYDKMPPFLMSIVSNSDLWMFISSNGALTAGRKNPDNALFPYYTDDRIHDSHGTTGGRTIMFVNKDDKTFLWEPFLESTYNIYNAERNIYKNTTGNKVIFEEVNYDLSLTCRYSWMNCDKFGFIKKTNLINNNSSSVYVNILDGIQNILPSGTDRKFQLEYSTLLDAYKKNELIDEAGLGLFTLSSIPVDKAEPSEALRATSVWSVGLEEPVILLSTKQIPSFIKGSVLHQEKSSKGVRGAYFLQCEFELLKENQREWYIVSDLNKDQADIAELALLLRSKSILKEVIENEIIKDTNELSLRIAKADGCQLTSDPLATSRHYSNVIFNIMRGGLFDNNYQVDKDDFCKFVKKANYKVWGQCSTEIDKLPEHFEKSELVSFAANLKNPDFERLCYEYLPLTFSRRHGDPSRPWNLFSIDIKDEHGNEVLNYQGNWRDIFQNWEALAFSFPGYIENMIVKFVNASTADGYNPYKVTRDSFEWETLDPSDSWSYIGYWGDHQVIYLLRLLEQSVKYHPGFLSELLTKEIFTYANVPYRIKTYSDIVKDPNNTIDFNFNLDNKLRETVKEEGTDGKYIHDSNDDIYHVNLAEKLLLPVLVKLSNFIPEAGIWMNTQRPEWNDANNALVGSGASMVTLYYLRKFISFSKKLFREFPDQQIKLSGEVLELLYDINKVFIDLKHLLNGAISDADRKKVTDKLGEAGSLYRSKIYSKGFSGEKILIQINDILLFFELALDYIDHSIAANKREDDLYHSYNLIKINDNKIKIRHLYEMLEGQVAVLSSGFLSSEDAIILLSSLRRSRLYRKDQASYLLYPERELPRFTEKNIIPAELVEKSGFLKQSILEGEKNIVIKDVKGDIHFNSRFRNVSCLKEALENYLQCGKLTCDEKETILEIYETVFDHQSFTGRSGTFYKYEGLGSIYWHMVSKLRLAVQENLYKAIQASASASTSSKLEKFYNEIREGIGEHKSPELYGAFPTDPYSHTPAGTGAQQPGMTGQVKEDIIARFGELGISVQGGAIHFIPELIDKEQFLKKSQVYHYYDINGRQQTLMLNAGMLAFTICQTPVIYIQSNIQKVILSRKEDIEEEINGLVVDKEISSLIFRRDGIIKKIKVLIDK